MLPAQVRASLGERPFDTRVFGDFLVCPLSRQQSGAMQTVCVADARRLVARPNKVVPGTNFR